MWLHALSLTHAWKGMFLLEPAWVHVLELSVVTGLQLTVTKFDLHQQVQIQPGSQVLLAARCSQESSAMGSVA